MSTVSRPSGEYKQSSPRRANGQGSISLRADGAYEVRVTLTGNRRRKRILRRNSDESLKQFRKRAEKAAEQLLSSVDQGHVVPSGHITVSDFSQLWLRQEEDKSKAGRGLSASTVDFYRQVFDNYVIPFVGSRPLPQLSTQDVEEMMNQLASAGRSPRTIQAAKNALGRLLGAALRDGLVSRVATVGASQIRRSLSNEDCPTSKALEPEQVRRLFEAAKGTKWEPLLALLAFLGLRRGEALGLSWQDIDFERGIVTIRRSLSRVRIEGQSQLVLAPTKTRSSRRPLPMPPILLSSIRVWKLEQTRQRLLIGENWGGNWAETNLVFTTPLGTPVDPNNLRHALDRLGRSAGIDHIHPHQLRHTVASVLIANGHTPPEVAKVLGHSSPAVTMAFYAHAFDKSTVRAIDGVADTMMKKRSV